MVSEIKINVFEVMWPQNIYMPCKNKGREFALFTLSLTVSEIKLFSEVVWCWGGSCDLKIQIYIWSNLKIENFARVDYKFKLSR